MLSTIAAGSSAIYVWLILFALGTGLSLLLISTCIRYLQSVVQAAWMRTPVGFRSPSLKKYLDSLKMGFEIVAATGISACLSVLALTGLLESGVWSELAKELGLLLFFSGLSILIALASIAASYRGETKVWNKRLWPS